MSVQANEKTSKRAKQDRKKKRKEEIVDTRTNLLPEVRFTNEPIRHRVNKQWRLIKLNTITSLVKIKNKNCLRDKEAQVNRHGV